MTVALTDIQDLPGASLIIAGLRDVAHQMRSESAFLVQIASDRLNRHGFAVCVSPEDALNADHALYHLLASNYGDEAHGRYNALLRELVSFERALEHRYS